MRIIHFSGFVLLLVIISCTPEHCFEGNESFLKATFYSSATNMPVTPDSVTMNGTSMDTLRLYNQMQRLTTALIPLNPATDSVEYMIRINGVTDTIRLNYTSYYHFISKECGFTYYHDLTSDSIRHTYYGIDSVTITRRNITIANEENLRIYY